MKPRAKVKPEFIELVCELANKELRSIRDQSFATADRDNFMLMNAEIIRQLAGLVRKDMLAIDRLKTNLRGLDYKSFSLYDRGETQYLVGKTNPIKMAKYLSSKNAKPHQYFDAGAYWVYIKASSFLAKSLDDIHMIPERSPTALARHPHIYAKNPGDHRSPLDFDVSICWSGFAQLVSGAADDHDIASLFRYIHLYLGRWARGSEWGQCNNISFIQDYPLEYA